MNMGLWSCLALLAWVGLLGARRATPSQRCDEPHYRWSAKTDTSLAGHAAVGTTVTEILTRWTTPALGNRDGCAPRAGRGRGRRSGSLGEERHPAAHQWPLGLEGSAAERVDRGAEAQAEGKGGQFAVLKPWLLGEVPSLSQADAARELGLSEGAVKVAVHRLRKRFREMVKAEIAQTVGDAAQVEEELRYLVEVLTQPDAS